MRRIVEINYWRAMAQGALRRMRRMALGVIGGVCARTYPSWQPRNVRALATLA